MKNITNEQLLMTKINFYGIFFVTFALQVDINNQIVFGLENYVK